MCFQNKPGTGLILLSALFMVVLFPSVISGLALDQNSSKGLRVNLVDDPSMLFNHAEILVYYSDVTNPLIPHLTLMNIFDTHFKDPQSGLLNTLFKMGNDYEVDYNVDHFIIRVNFLPADTNLFISFLKGLFSYGDFSLKDFNYSINNFWKLFKKNPQWETILSTQIAFSHFFRKDYSGKFQVTGKNPSRINLSQIRSFYKNNYILPNAFVTIRGDIKPYFVFGLVEKAFRHFKGFTTAPKKLRYNMADAKRKVIVVDTGINGTPHLYWMNPIPPKGDLDHQHAQIVNNLLFGYPLGRISRNASASGIKNFNIVSAFHHHRNISFVFRKIRLGYRDIEKFIFIADNNISKLSVGRISRKEYLDNYNFIYQKGKIESDDYRKIASNTVTRSFYKKDNTLTRNRREKLLKELNYANFSKLLSDPKGIYSAGRNRKRGIIVIFCNAALLKRYIRTIKPEVITLR